MIVAEELKSLEGDRVGGVRGGQVGQVTDSVQYVIEGQKTTCSFLGFSHYTLSVVLHLHISNVNFSTSPSIHMSIVL